jgi:hypothetical protein
LLSRHRAVQAPTGDYNSQHLVNISVHRWAFKPEIGLSQPIGNWFVEGATFERPGKKIRQHWYWSPRQEPLQPRYHHLIAKTIPRLERQRPAPPQALSLLARDCSGCH